MNIPAARLAGATSNGIQVSGLTWFPESRWREAILFYLFGVWAGHDNVTYRPKLCFGDITFRLGGNEDEYYAYGHAEVPEEIPLLQPADLVETSGKQDAVEVALIRFVKDNRIRQLRLCLPSVTPDAAFVLWKKAKRGEYGYAGIGLPFTWGTKGPVWTREEFERSF